MNKVLLSNKPKWCSLIADGKKKIEVRKTAPKEVPFKCLIYCTKHGKELIKQDIPTTINYIAHNGGKIIGEFVCDKVIKYEAVVIGCAKYEVNGGYVEEKNRYNAGACLTAEEMFDYSNGKPLYGWHISDLKIYYKPKELSEFISANGKCSIGYSSCSDGVCGHYPCSKKHITRPPQSWQYIEVNNEI